jgi:predicted nucleic acid-binding protein
VRPSLLAKTLPEGLLVISDKAARRVAAHEGVHCVDIPGVLHACKETSVLDTAQSAEMLTDRDVKHHDTFTEQTKDGLLRASMYAADGV